MNELVFNQPIETGAIRAEFFGDTEKAKGYITAGRKILGAVRTFNGVNQRIAEGEAGGFYRHLAQLEDGTQIEVLTNNGMDTVRIYAAPAPPSNSPITDINIENPEKLELELAGIIEEYLKPIPRILATNQQVFTVVSMDTDSAPIFEKNLGANVGQASGGFNSYLASLPGKWNFYDRNWVLLNSVSAPFGGYNFCIFVAGNYYTMEIRNTSIGGTIITAYTETGAIFGVYSAIGYQSSDYLTDISPDVDGETFWTISSRGIVTHYTSDVLIIAQWDTGYGVSTSSYLTASDNSIYIVHNGTALIKKYTLEGVSLASYNINNNFEQFSGLLWINENLYAANTVYSSIPSTLDTPGISKFDADLNQIQFYPIGNIYLADGWLRADYGFGDKEFSPLDPQTYGAGEVRISRTDSSLM